MQTRMSDWFAFATAFLCDSVPNGLKAYGQEELKKEVLFTIFIKYFLQLKGFDSLL